MRSRFNMFPVVEGKETKANTIGKAAIIGGCILTFGMHLFYKENGARIWTYLSEIFVAYFLLDYLFLSIGGCIQCSRRIGKRVRVGIVILALVAVLFTLLLCFLEKAPTLTLLPYSIILVYAVVGYRNYNSVKKSLAQTGQGAHYQINVFVFQFLYNVQIRLLRRRHAGMP